MKIGILIQARTGSSRLPQKVVRPFYEDNTLIDIILSKLKILGLPLILATSDQVQDRALEVYSKKHNALFFAGDENNVLRRFVDAAEKNELDVVIRVCADNPFIQPDYIRILIEEYLKKPHSYVSFFNREGLPVIKTHYGFFAELVELKTLKDVLERTSDKLYLEHVTNYIYAHPELYSIKRLEIPFTEPEKQVRLTIDTQEDYNIVSALYKECKDYSPKEIISRIMKDEELFMAMQAEVLKNSK
jgi:spore coat polysaccharide biosynthesis protein SpsF